MFQVWAKQVCSHGQVEEQKYEYYDLRGENKRRRRKLENEMTGVDRKVYAEYNKDELRFAQLANIFPEYRALLNLYENCCDQNGKIVKNHAYYREYKQTPHSHGKRGGQ